MGDKLTRRRHPSGRYSRAFETVALFVALVVLLSRSVLASVAFSSSFQRRRRPPMAMATTSSSTAAAAARVAAMAAARMIPVRRTIPTSIRSISFLDVAIRATTESGDMRRRHFHSRVGASSTRAMTSLAATEEGGGRGDEDENDDDDRDEDAYTFESGLECKLRSLALLNDGRMVNPRSPRQVSTLLYSGDASGPTDRATLMRIASGRSGDGVDDDADDAYDDIGATSEEDNGRRRMREVASLVLQCRELLSSTHNPDASVVVTGRRNRSTLSSNASSSFVGPSIARRTMKGKAPMSSIAANFSTTTSTDGDEYEDRIDVGGQVRGKAASTPGYAIPPMSSYEVMVMNLFSTDESGKRDDTDLDVARGIHPDWIEPLLSLTKSSSRSLVGQLSMHASCPMGFDPQASPMSRRWRGGAVVPPAPASTPLLSFVREQKSTHFPDAVLLIRVGDFYESYGIDAIMLVEHCGLNPMAGKARAGCPWRGVQETLDKLTSAGFRVAVYEEDEREKKSGYGWSRNDEVDADMGITGGGRAGKLKTRYLAQVVSPSNPTYMHNLVLNDDSSGASTNDDASSTSNIDLSHSGRNHVGIIETNAGYTLVEIRGDERAALISERLTSEAIACRLTAFPPADPLFYVPPSTMAGSPRRSDRLPFLPWTQRHQASQRFTRDGGILGGATAGTVRVKTLPPSLVVDPRPGLSDVERAKQTIVSAYLRLEEYDHRNTVSIETSPPRRKRLTSSAITHEDYTIVVAPSSMSETATITRPLHLETATQLGLMSDTAIPSLISSLLPESAPSSIRRYLRRWLLVPPPPEIADAMSVLVRTLKADDKMTLPPFMLNAPHLSGKVISLIRAGQASAAVYREILMALDAASKVLLLDRGEEKDNASGIVNALMTVLRHDMGFSKSHPMVLRTKLHDAMEIIESVINTQTTDYSLKNVDEGNEHESSEKDCVSFYEDIIPPAFFERNEAIWRGRVKPTAIERHAKDVSTAARRLAEAVAVDFWGVDEDIIDYDNNCTIINMSEAKESKSPIVQDIFNNLLLIKSIPSWVEQRGSDNDATSDKVERTDNVERHHYFAPRDRNGKLLRARFTTERVQEAMSNYVEACSSARFEVERVLTRLSWNVVDGGHLPAILQSSRLNLILATAAHHSASANVKGWSAAIVYDDNNSSGIHESSAGYFSGLWPYWMGRSESVSNSFDLDGLFLLTAPNMSGKSTLMRATAAAALLINAGLCAPVKPGSRVRRFDSIFLRGASADVPTEDKSAFGAEMGDVASLLRSCGSKSLVFVDEIGRGTSPKDGTSLAGAILEQMSGVYRMSGMFATHLHGILNLPYSSTAEARLRRKRMAVTEDYNGESKWTYLLEDGVCTNR
jgi:hypothetical protein